MNLENFYRKLTCAQLLRVRSKNLREKWTRALTMAAIPFSAISLSSVCLAQTNSESLAVADSPSQLIIGRFASLPPIPGQPIDFVAPEINKRLLVSQARFIPIPALEDLPPAPESLIALANSLQSVSSNSNEQTSIRGSDSAKELRETPGIEVLSKPISPFEIVQNSRSKDAPAELQPSLVAHPDPRYFNHWPQTNALWDSPAFCFKPLYFEQTNLERYGIGYPSPTNALVSGSRFFADAALFPIKALRQPPHSCQCTLGHRRPGDCNPIQR
jgi:hypothetical protein